MNHVCRFLCLPALLLSFAFLSTAEAGVQQSWKLFQGNYFKVGIPTGFTVVPPGEINNDASDMISFWNPDSQVGFTVWVPLWDGESLAKELKGRGEVLSTRKRIRDDDVIEEKLTITARDKSYIRYVTTRTNKATNNCMAFGIQVPNLQVYAQVEATYSAWKNTFVQTAY